MKTKPYILTLFFLIGFLKAYSCSCGYLGGFIYSNQAADIVVYGTVIEYDSIGTYNSPNNPYSIKFLIKEKLRGIESRDTVTIWGDYGTDCRPYINQFKPKTEWILALDQLNNNGNGAYEISICGEFYVPVNKKKVQGKIFGWNNKETEKNYDYDYIKSLVLTPQNNLLQRPKKYILKTDKGMEYMTYCDILPQNTLDFDTLNKIVCEKIDIPLTFMNRGDSYLIHMRVIIDKSGEFYFNGTYNLNKTIELIAIENQIAKTLRNTGNWKVGYEANMPVTSELIIPIILKK